MDSADIVSRLTNDFPQHKFEVVDITPPKDDSEFRKLLISIDGTEHKITMKSVDVIMDEIKKFHVVDKELVEDAIYSAIRFEVVLFIDN